MPLSTLQRGLPALLGLLLAMAPLAQVSLETRASFNVALSGAAEVPAVTTGASGQVVASLDGGELTLVGFFEGLESNFNTAIGAHIHIGGPAENGGVAQALTVALSGDLRSGLFLPEDNTFTADGDLITALRNGNAYINVHSIDNPGGEIRGQMVPKEFYINELRVDQPGSDTDDYIEIAGIPGASLNGITLVVIGDDGTAGQGAIEEVEDLSSATIPADGYLYIGESSATLGTPDLTLDLNFENNQSSTFLLVRGFTGADGDDLDTDDDGTPDSAPWTEIVDVIGIDNDDDADIAYAEELGGIDVEVGSGNTRPSHILVTDEGYPAAGFYAFLGDTPGAENGDTAPLQIIHNSPDPAADVVDIYVNGLLAFNDVPFRGATPYTETPTGVDLQFDVTDEAAADNSAPLVSVTGSLPDGTFQVYAQGVADPAQFAANPDNVDTDLELALNTVARMFPLSLDYVSLNVVHGSPDAPTVKVRADGALDVTDFLEYTDFTSYAEVAPGVYTLDIVTESGAVAATFDADLTPFTGEAISVLASGFLDPSANQNGPGFALLVVTSGGETALLDARPVDVDGTPGEGLALVAENPVAGSGTITYSLAAAGEATLAVYDVLGRRVAVLAEGAQPAEVQSVRFDASALASGTYVLRLVTGEGSLSRTITVVR